MQKNLPDRYSYPAVFVYSKDSEISVDFPDLGVATSGVSEKDAILSAQELLGIAMLGLEEDGEAIPKPTPIHNIKARENEKINLIDIYMPPLRQQKNHSTTN